MDELNKAGKKGFHVEWKKKTCFERNIGKTLSSEKRGRNLCGLKENIQRSATIFRKILIL